MAATMAYIIWQFETLQENQQIPITFSDVWTDNSKQILIHMMKKPSPEGKESRRLQTEFDTITPCKRRKLPAHLSPGQAEHCKLFIASS